MLIVKDLEVLSYQNALDLQQKFCDSLKTAKRNGETVGDEYLLLVEHPPVYTLGKHAKEHNLLVSAASLAGEGIEIHHISRGGDITFHGPGQLVAYPIIDLQKHRLGIKAYVNLLEQSVIDTVAEFGISGVRDEGATGVWLNDSQGLRKICAIGVSVSRSVTMHGLALNINTDLSYFGRINPCGFTDRGVTSISRETGDYIDFESVKKIFSEKFISILNNK